MFSFPMLTLTLGIDIFEMLTPEIGALIWKAPFPYYASGGEDVCKTCLLF